MDAVAERHRSQSDDDCGFGKHSVARPQCAATREQRGDPDGGDHRPIDSRSERGQPEAFSDRSAGAELEPMKRLSPKIGWVRPLGLPKLS